MKKKKNSGRRRRLRPSPPLYETSLATMSCESAFREALDILGLPQQPLLPSEQVLRPLLAPAAANSAALEPAATPPPPPQPVSLGASMAERFRARYLDDQPRQGELTAGSSGSGDAPLVPPAAAQPAQQQQEGAPPAAAPRAGRFSAAVASTLTASAPRLQQQQQQQVLLQQPTAATLVQPWTPHVPKVPRLGGTGAFTAAVSRTLERKAVAAPLAAPMQPPNAAGVNGAPPPTRGFSAAVSASLRTSGDSRAASDAPAAAAAAAGAVARRASFPTLPPSTTPPPRLTSQPLAPGAHAPAHQPSGAGGIIARARQPLPHPTPACSSRCRLGPWQQRWQQQQQYWLHNRGNGAFSGPQACTQRRGLCSNAHRGQPQGERIRCSGGRGHQ